MAGDRSPNGPKLTCPECLGERSEVLPDKYRTGQDTDGTRAFYRRVRECIDCGARFTSTERVERIIRRRTDKKPQDIGYPQG
jgi:transcriptional regulator NrdR family protein